MRMRDLGHQLGGEGQQLMRGEERPLREGGHQAGQEGNLSTRQGGHQVLQVLECGHGHGRS